MIFTLLLLLLLLLLLITYKKAFRLAVVAD
jgi:hypothetical protein